MILVALQLLYPRAWLYQEQRPFVLDLLGATVKKISECMNILKGRTVIMDGDADLSFSGHREGDFSASEELRPLCPHTLFWFFSFLLWPLLICRFILLHLATKCGNSSKLVLDPYFFPTLSLRGSNMQMSSTCQYLQIHFYPRLPWAPTLIPNDVFNYFYLDVSNSQYTPDETHDLLFFFKFPPGFPIYHTFHLTTRNL